MGDDGVLKRWRRILQWIEACRIRVGCDPRRIEAPALVFFPYRPCLLCCGFAGILALRLSQAAQRPASEPHPCSEIHDLFSRAVQNDLQAFLRGAIPAEAYLGGTATQGALESRLFLMKGEEAFGRIFYDEGEARRLALLAERIRSFLAQEERLLEEQAGRISTADLEAVNRGLVLLRDVVWGIEKDILENIGRTQRLAGAGGDAGVAPEALAKYRKMNFLLNSLDRLEVRGRDSAGIQFSFVPADSEDVARVMDGLRMQGIGGELERRTARGDLRDGSITGPSASTPGSDAAGRPVFSFTYKTAEIIGELGRNVRELRKRIADDRVLQAFARIPAAFETAFTHTRWASVGSITEENCHPIGNHALPSGDLASVSSDRHFPAYGRGFWNIHAVLNGDIDNYQSLREEFEAEGGTIAPEVTTDTKIIPLRIEKYLLAGHDLTESFRRAVCDFEGSHAIAMSSDVEPGRIFLALRGSGQSIYIGIAPDRYLFSSELYGLVEETPFFIKMDGERPSHPEKPGSAGQIAVLDQEAPGGASGIRGIFYDGTPLPFGQDAVQRAEITTRDIDRGDYPHYFLKEISESVLSVRKTLRGKYRIEQDGHGRRVVFNIGPDIVPEGIRKALRERQIRRISVIGHGTAAVAGSAVAEAMERFLDGSGIRVEARIASELSGFCMEHDLHETLVIPITQSGTTTDTNRAVAMASERGAKVIAIVNRRQSDITAKSDGVFYTSDGRDIEMAVASTKAFYSQIVAGHILALVFAHLLSTLSDERIAEEFRLLECTPAMMGKVLGLKEGIRGAVEGLAKQKRHWAVVGSGPNRTAAEEIRIKLSELCYQTISADVVENKKHIDLSAEPLILVCASGSPEKVIGDIAKDVAIFKAHKAAVVVFADEGERRFDGVADAVIRIPRAPLPISVILNTVAGHLFGYYAACSIDADALFLRAFKSRLNLIMVEQARQNLSVHECIADSRMRRIVNEFGDRFRRLRNLGDFSQSGVRTLSDLILLLKYAAGKLPIDDFRHDFPDAAVEESPIDLLDFTLGRAVDELSRPIDAIRHQAKTVTVGTSRKEEPPGGLLFDLLAGLSFSAKSLRSTNVVALRRIQKAISAVNGHTLYAVHGLDAEGKPGDDATIEIRQRNGVSLRMRSRVEKSRTLMGTKRGIVASGRIYVGQGKSDGAPVVIVPILGEDERIRHLLLIHVTFNESLPLRERKELLGERTGDIRNLIQEFNLPWEDRYLGEIPLAVLLGEPVEVIAGQIRRNLERPAPDGA